MKNKILVLVILIVVFAFQLSQGQLNTSGNGVTQVGTWTVQPGNTANTTAWLVTGTGGTFPVTGTFWQATQPVSGTFWQATQPISGTVSSVPKTACGTTLATGSTLAAVPTSATLLTSAATACAVAAVFFNTNSSAATVTLTDNTATPINAVLTFSIPGLSNLVEPLYGGAFNFSAGNLALQNHATGIGVCMGTTATGATACTTANNITVFYK